MQRTNRTQRILTGVIAVFATVSLSVGCSDSDSGNGDADSEKTERSTAPEATTPPADANVVLETTGEVIATVDRRYQSYNVEMVEVTGGEFWKPYDAGKGKVIRPPIDLSSERLRNLAKALGPAYIRVSGSWANSTYFDAEGTTGGQTPEGYGGVLSTDQWIGVSEFAKAVGGEITTSFPSNTGARDASGAWNPAGARALLRFTKDNDIPLVAVEFINEPSLPIGVPTGYDAAAYAADFATFVEVVRSEMPDLRIVGPSAAGDVGNLVITPSIPAEDMFRDTGAETDVVSYHFYPKVSERCSSTEGPDVALSAEFLSRIVKTKDFYEGLRDRYVPEAPTWITETAQAACGGDRWAAQYVDVIRYVDTLGRLADGDGNAVFHNTLAASDYGLIDEKDLSPRPNYWAALLWGRLMGTKSLATKSGPAAAPDLAVYAHCTPEAKEPSVTYAVINSSTDASRTVATSSGEATVYLLTGDSLESKSISLNGTPLEANEDGTPPAVKGKPASGVITIPPASVAFVVERSSSGCE